MLQRGSCALVSRCNVLSSFPHFPRHHFHSIVNHNTAFAFSRPSTRCNRRFANAASKYSNSSIAQLDDTALAQLFHSNIKSTVTVEQLEKTLKTSTTVWDLCISEANKRLTKLHPLDGLKIFTALVWRRRASMLNERVFKKHKNPEALPADMSVVSSFEQLALERAFLQTYFPKCFTQLTLTSLVLLLSLLPQRTRSAQQLISLVGTHVVRQMRDSPTTAVLPAYAVVSVFETLARLTTAHIPLLDALFHKVAGRADDSSLATDYTDAQLIKILHAAQKLNYSTSTTPGVEKLLTLIEKRKSDYLKHIRLKRARHRMIDLPLFSSHITDLLRLLQHPQPVTFLSSSGSSKTHTTGECDTFRLTSATVPPFRNLLIELLQLPEATQAASLLQDASVVELLQRLIFESQLIDVPQTVRLAVLEKSIELVNNLPLDHVILCYKECCTLGVLSAATLGPVIDVLAASAPVMTVSQAVELVGICAQFNMANPVLMDVVDTAIKNGTACSITLKECEKIQSAWKMLHHDSPHSSALVQRRCRLLTTARNKNALAQAHVDDASEQTPHCSDAARSSLVTVITYEASTTLYSKHCKDMKNIKLAATRHGKDSGSAGSLCAETLLSEPAPLTAHGIPQKKCALLNQENTVNQGLTVPHVDVNTNDEQCVQRQTFDKSEFVRKEQKIETPPIYDNVDSFLPYIDQEQLPSSSDASLDKEDKTWWTAAQRQAKQQRKKAALQSSRYYQRYPKRHTKVILTNPGSKPLCASKLTAEQCDNNWKVRRKAQEKRHQACGGARAATALFRRRAYISGEHRYKKAFTVPLV